MKLVRAIRRMIAWAVVVATTVVVAAWFGMPRELWCFEIGVPGTEVVAGVDTSLSGVVLWRYGPGMTTFRGYERGLSMASKVSIDRGPCLPDIRSSAGVGEIVVPVWLIAIAVAVAAVLVCRRVRAGWKLILTGVMVSAVTVGAMSASPWRWRQAARLVSLPWFSVGIMGDERAVAVVQSPGDLSQEFTVRKAEAMINQVRDIWGRGVGADLGVIGGRRLFLASSRGLYEPGVTRIILVEWWILAAVLGSGTGVMCWRAWPGRPRSTTECVRCGFDLSGQREPGCPECGAGREGEAGAV